MAPFYIDYVDRFSLVTASPKLNLEVIGDLTFTLHLNMAELTFKFNMYPFKFTPFDILLRMDATHPSRYCTGMDYIVRTFLMEIMVEWRVKECIWGTLGIVTDND